MSADSFVLDGTARVGKFVLWLKSLTFKPGRVLVVKAEWMDPSHSDAQRAKLRALERQFAKHCGYDPDELHEILLASRFGTKPIKLRQGILIERPLKRSSDLNRTEMSDYIDWVNGMGREAGAW